MQGLDTINGVEVVFNTNLPSATAETLANMNLLKSMGAISVETIMEKADLIVNKDVELDRIKGEQKEAEKKAEKEMAKQAEMFGNGDTKGLGDKSKDKKE
jgi:hypothetical protein